MERRDRSLKILNELIYIDSLDSYEKADSLVRWAENYLSDNFISELDLEIDDVKKLKELFFKNINFLIKQKDEARGEIANLQKMKKFLKNN